MVAARQLGASAIACVTESGGVARLVSEYRPESNIVAFTSRPEVFRRLALYWGVLAKVMEPVKNADLMAELVAERLVEDGVAKTGDRVVLVHGSPLGVPGHTNSIRLHEIAAQGERGPGQRYRVPI